MAINIGATIAGHANGWPTSCKHLLDIN